MAVGQALGAGKQRSVYPSGQLGGAVMATAVVLEEDVEIPMDLRSLADFRRWATSDDFPERGRIDYIAGRIEVDMSPEDLFRHGTLKGEIHGVLYQLVKEHNLGHLFFDRARVSSPEADLSAEPDIVFVSHEALAEGRVRLVPGAAGGAPWYVEMEGAPDLVAEVVSNSSVAKDTRRLPAAYFKAGVREFWLADARREPLVSRIHRRGESAFEPVEPNAEGFQRSPVFDCAFRLDGRCDPEGKWMFDLRKKP
jgi:Uma2 family endonuclease